MRIDQSDFATQKELFDYLIANKGEILSLKKSQLKCCDSILLESPSEDVVKALSTNNVDNLNAGIITRTVIGNTYGWMDSHNDVHVKGVFTKSISENKNIVHLHDHIQQITSKVGTPKRVYEDKISWSDLGINVTGKAMALFMDTEIKRAYNPIVYDQYLNGEINQHSVGMRYVNLFLAVNDENYKEEKANWDTYISHVANKDKAEKAGFFWAVTEAKLVEISAVIAGSNELTPTLPNKSTPKNQPGAPTDNNEPEKEAKEKAKKEFYLKLLN